MKELVAVPYKFYKKYLQNLKYNVNKKACIFQLILVGIPCSLRTGGGGGSGGFYLNKKIC